MRTRPLPLAALAATLLLAQAAHAGVRFGVEGAGAPLIPLSGFLQSKDVELKNGVGYSMRASLILGSWFFGYEFGAITNGQACAGGTCNGGGDNGTTKLHSWSANYHIYFIEKPVRPYLLFGAGALFGTLGNWQTQGQAGNLFGADFRAGLGIEIPIGGHVFVSLEARYRFLVTNNPMADVQQQVLSSILGGQQPSAGDLFQENVKTTHMFQGIAGVGFHF